MGFTLGLPVELDLLLPARPKKYEAGFRWQCFTNLGTIESNLGKSGIMEKEEYIPTQIKWYLVKRQDNKRVISE